MVYGRVYSIRSHQTTDIYIGSTTQILCKRLADHRREHKRFLEKNIKYVASFQILEHGDAYIELLFEGEFESVDALRKKEGEYQREMECVNKYIAGRTFQEYKQDNKIQIARIDNIRKKIKVECECGTVCNIGDKHKHIKSKKHFVLLAKKI